MRSDAKQEKPKPILPSPLKKGGNMPGNLIVINGSKELTWYVGDSHMDEVITLLDTIGSREEQDGSEDE